MKKYLLGTLALAAFVAPLASFAQMYAYVNEDGEVRTVEANDPNTAISTAPAIDEHSGVLLLDGSDDQEVVGDNVSGV
jgi:hypothetical protein